VQLARHVVFWLNAGVLCWLGIATILLWRGAPGMPMGSETPGQIAFAAAVPLVMRSLPAALLGALAGGALRWALLLHSHATPAPLAFFTLDTLLAFRPMTNRAPHRTDQWRLTKQRAFLRFGGSR
jgi:hypothetical protein